MSPELLNAATADGYAFFPSPCDDYAAMTVLSSHQNYEEACE